MEQIIAQFRLHTQLLKNVCKDFTPEQAQQTHGDANHVKWLVGHMVSTRYYTANLLGIKMEFKYAELFKHGSAPVAGDQYPDLAAFLAEWETISPVLVAHLEQMSADTWATEAPFAFPIHDGSLRGSFTFMADHEAYHIGQIAYARRIVGLAGMKYA